MRSNKRVFIGVGIGVALVLFGFFLLYRQIWGKPLEPVAQPDTTLNLGITYLPVTARVASYYGLAVDSGALITEVVPGSPAALAGIEAGDVILTFNGVRVEDEASLFGMMMACPMGTEVELEVWRGNAIWMVHLVHSGD